MNVSILGEIIQTVTVYTGPYRPYCTMARRLLQTVGVKEISGIRIDGDSEVFAEMQQLSGQHSMPQIFTSDTHVGGFTDLYHLQQEGKLDELLDPQPLTQENKTSKELQPIFSVERLYMKDLSLRVPHAPQIFLEQDEPGVGIHVSTGNTKLEDGFYSADVTITVAAKLNEERTIFLNEVTQSGIFRLKNIPEEDVQLLLGVACPNILFPYAREAISSSVTRAGFPSVLLAPINFEAIYQQQQEANA